MFTFTYLLKVVFVSAMHLSNLDSVLKSRDSTLPANVHIVKAMVFLVVMYECESWTIKRVSAEEMVLEKT